jgi:hypothetical protein
MKQELWVIETSTCSCCSFPEYVASEEEAKRVCEAISGYHYYKYAPMPEPTLTLVGDEVSEFIDERLYENARNKIHFEAKKRFEGEHPYPETGVREWYEDFECECWLNMHSYIEQCRWEKDLNEYIQNALALVPNPTNRKESK